ncbi:transposon Ty3-I Gag-Pol polyprotein [Trichonephila inaurata madagascariensis]|uniref:Transposon Ty3-I Gag-Pol polyprotein n=1 Tax=Trichonephila inaurata madagascariensis TaxID=2747483 RepID=A0A8X6IRP9_9ARAC|nr:transposon Ty3-I Gag-Pol polyprotein [Trichonephila inaurata madagascariensis]
MAFLSKGKKIDLYNLASELRVSVTLDDRIIELREKITTCTFFKDNEKFVKEILDNIVEERKSLEVEVIKKREHTWEKLNDPVVLAEKLDSYENVKPSSQKLTKLPKPRELNNPPFSRNTGNLELRKSHSFKVEKNVSGNHKSNFANPSYMPARNINTGCHPPISYYGCGVDFLRTSGIVMDMRNNFWYFVDKPSFRILFAKDAPLPVDDSPVEINSTSCGPQIRFPVRFRYKATLSMKLRPLISTCENKKDRP